MLFERTAPGGVVEISNQSTNTPQPVRVRLTGHGVEHAISRLLAPGQTWRSDEAIAK